MKDHDASTRDALEMIFHVDMDSFFSSIESRDHPEYRGIPLVVGADPKNGTGRGVVSTCSYEARKFGLHSAMPISQAYRLCPHAIFVRPDHHYYSEVSSRIMEVLRGFSTLFEQRSIDEAYLEVGHADFDMAFSIARSIKDAVLEAVGLVCSVGVGPGKAVAKIASDLDKPDGITVVRPEELRTILDPLPISRIPGIGKKGLARYHELGIETIGVLARYDREQIERRFGSQGLHVQDIARGVDNGRVRPREGSRSISRERTFHEDTDEWELLASTLDALCRKVHRDLEEEGYWFRTLTIKIRYHDFNTYTRAVSMKRPGSSLEDIRQLASLLFEKHWNRGLVRLMGVRLSGFREVEERQTTLDQWVILRERSPGSTIRTEELTDQ